MLNKTRVVQNCCRKFFTHWRDRCSAESQNPRVASIAINMTPTSSSWGGGNQWLQQFIWFLTLYGYHISFDLNSSVDCIILVDPRVGGLIKFGAEEIKHYKQHYPQTVCIHRINECDQRKHTHEMDELLRHANQVADFTIFISKWLLNYHRERWFDQRQPHCVIYNGADPKIFHPIGSLVFSPQKPLRLVTHHWSDNWNKGFRIYQEIDRLIAAQNLVDTELWVIGRWPKELQWNAAKTFKPVNGMQLASLLRQCHVYVTASLWEPCGMHHIEGAQCGLPVLYHEDGGGIVESACQYGVAFRDEIGEAVLQARQNYHMLRQQALELAPSGSDMCTAYQQIIQRLIAKQCEKNMKTYG